MQKLPTINGRKVEMTPSPYGPYELGYTHVTMGKTIWHTQ
jgi:hypothetical protein